jgi:hypothetical protein
MPGDPMDKPEQADTLIAEVDEIIADCKRSLRLLREWSSHPSASRTKIVSRCFSEVDAAEFEQLIKAHRRALLRVQASLGDPRKQQAMARRLIWSSLAAHTCAVLRAMVRKNQYASPDQIRAMASGGKRWQPPTEPVTAWWKRKPKGGYRLMTKDGVARTAQRLVLRDMLTTMNIDSEFDYSRKGKGEKALLKQVCNLMDSEFDWWVMLDIKNYYASLKPGHFGWLPLTRQEIRNIVFTPKCAEVVVKLPKQMEQLIQWLKQHYPTSNMNTKDDVVVFTTQLVRQGGLPQGAVHSPLLARGFVGRSLQALFGGKEGIVGLSWVDDLTIGTRLKVDAQAAVHALTEHFDAHPAGPLELHTDYPVASASRKVEVLGYFLEPGNGYGGAIHVKPGPKRFAKFRANLKARLQAAEPHTDLYKIGEAYRKQWYSAQQAWTKVPGHSELLSQNITDSYVDDFKHKILMGGNHPTMAKIAKGASATGPAAKTQPAP